MIGLFFKYMTNGYLQPCSEPEIKCKDDLTSTANVKFEADLKIEINYRVFKHWLGTGLLRIILAVTEAVMDE